MSDRERILFYQYYLFKGDQLKTDREKAIAYLRKNDFTFDYDFIQAWKSILAVEFFEKWFSDLIKFFEV